MADLPSRFGPYDILGPLGSGGMGQVFRGRDTRLQRLVAIKVLHDEAALDPDRQRRFAQEALAASALNHPNILTVYDVGTEDGTPYLVSELIDGESLRAEMNRGRVPLKRVVEIAHQIAEGLAAAHDAGIVHRDLKPENVMVTADGRVKIVDFGLAKAPLQGDALGSTHAATDTAAGLLVGTVPYMSPEQARGTPADFRSDQFSFGLMLHELATGSHPFKRETPVQTLSAIIADEPPDPGQATPPPPVALRWLLRRLLAKQPRQRYASTADLAADLRTLREHLSEAASGVMTSVAVAAPVRAVRPNRLRRAALGALLFALGAIASRTFAPDAAGLPFDRFTPLATDAGYQGAPAVARREGDSLRSGNRRRGADLHARDRFPHAHAGDAIGVRLLRADLGRGRLHLLSLAGARPRGVVAGEPGRRQSRDADRKCRAFGDRAGRTDRVLSAGPDRERH
jgi:hypothetical protein